MPQILIPTALRRFTDGADTAQISAATAGEALRALAAQFPELGKNLFNDEGKLRSFVNIYVNDEDIRYLQREATPVTATDTVSIVPSIAGGALSQEEMLRYSRQLIMPEVGVEGQEKLKAARVLMIGTGGLGAPIGMYLAAAGVGTIGLMDFDVVDATNLHRQVIHGTADVGRKKLDSAADRMLGINPNTTIIRHEMALSSENALGVIANYDLVVDGTDNFPTRYLVNDACMIAGKPNVYGSIFRFEGQATVFCLDDGPCYRCLYPEPPPPGLVPSCAEGGVLGILPGIVGLVQATEAVKLILGIGQSLKGRLLLYDALEMKFRELRLRRDPACAWHDRSRPQKLIDYQQFCGILPPPAGELEPREVKAKFDRGESFLLVDVREPHEWQIGRIDGAKLIPLGDLPQRLAELDPAAEIVMHCKAGGRSAKAVALLKEKGYANVTNMKGGILLWSDQVDASVPKY
ncbi:MAG: molybdopterin-synthase adenylyltransferase MoeB [Bryobacteraceae bacterium]|nr:molybdopterin-synthase adenylyltransferase MoeB [Bryobacteraceae bacterium]